LLGAWAAILNDPSLKRKAMAAHQAAKFLRPLAGALAAFGDAVTVTPVSAAELGSVDGARVLDDRLTNERARLDARGSTAHVVATGYPGSAQASRRLSEVCHRNRAFLWLDAPALRTLQEIRAAAAGGVLEGMGGTGDANRWKAACAIRVRTSRGVVADGVRLSEDTYISASSAIASAWLQSIAEGRRGEPVSGYASPLDESVDGVEVDLPLDPDENSGYRLLAEAGFIVAVLPSPGSRSVVLAGANTMQPGMQLLPALNELSAVRIAEEAIGRLSMFQGLDASRERVDDSVSQWLHERTGPGEMFRSGSTVTTIADHANNQIVVEYVLIQQSVTERAVIRIRNTAGAKKNGAVEWERTDG
jgi:hypothetical protein